MTRKNKTIRNRKSESSSKDRRSPVYNPYKNISTDIFVSLISEESKQLVREKIPEVFKLFHKYRGERKQSLNKDFIIGKILDDAGKENESNYHLALINVHTFNSCMKYWKQMYPKQGQIHLADTDQIIISNDKDITDSVRENTITDMNESTDSNASININTNTNASINTDTNTDTNTSTDSNTSTNTSIGTSPDVNTSIDTVSEKLYHSRMDIKRILSQPEEDWKDKIMFEFNINNDFSHSNTNELFSEMNNTISRDIRTDTSPVHIDRYDIDPSAYNTDINNEIIQEWSDLIM